MEGLLENLNGLIPLIPLLIFFATLVHRARKASARSKKKEAKASEEPERKNGIFPFVNPEIPRAETGKVEDPWPSERPAEKKFVPQREEPLRERAEIRESLARPSPVNEMPEKDSTSRVINTREVFGRSDTVFPARFPTPTVSGSTRGSLKRIEGLNPLARGLVWSLILDKPSSMKNPDER